ncbi:MAG: hypothetical protein V4482_00130 [Pseudomonadota bacterium]
MYKLPHLVAILLFTNVAMSADSLNSTELLLTNHARMRYFFNITPVSNTASALRVPKKYSKISITNNALIVIDLALSAGDYEAGSYSYVVFSSSTYSGEKPEIKYGGNLVGALSATTELRPMGDSIHVMLILTIPEHFRLVDSDEDTDSDVEN